MTPGEFLDALDAAAARPGRARVVLELTAPVVLGERGKRVDAGGPDPVYGFTRRQCRRMRTTLLRAAEEDAKAGGGP